jgi:hypothetical protein
MDLFKKVLKSLISESYESRILFGYHTTNRSNVDPIKNTGFKVGDRSMQGKGFYSFYDLDEAKGYAGKGEINDPVIVKFKITKPEKLLYVNIAIAKKVLGTGYGLKAYSLKNQVEEYYGSFERFKEQLSYEWDKKSDSEIESRLQEIEDNNSESNQRVFLFSMLSADANNKLNVVLDGNYGIEIRLNKTDLADPLGFYESKGRGDFSEDKFVPFDKISFFTKIPRTPTYSDLIEFIKDSDLIDADKNDVLLKIDQTMDKVRNSREYNALDSMYKIARSIK